MSLLIQCGRLRCKIHDAWKEIAIAALIFGCFFLLFISCTFFVRWRGSIHLDFFFFLFKCTASTLYSDKTHLSLAS